ncbi:PAS domain S-box protein [Hyphobacterium sp. CCMP332]|nr:PAS domain S-box protein [Hyphobacterium sp. CCMP332]
MKRPKKSDKEFEYIRRKYDQLWSESRDMIFICNSEYQIVDMNPSFRQNFGFRKNADISLKDIFHREEDFLRFNQQVYLKENIELFEVELKTRKKSVLPCLLSFFESIAIEGIDTFMGIIKDISTRKKAERQILMTEKLAVTGKIARNIAHEVRNPLTNLNLALDQLKDEISDNTEANVYTEIIARNATRIETLIGNLLNSSKQRQYNFSDENLNAILRESLKECNDRLVLKNIKLVDKISKKEFIKAVDKEALKVAFLNLFINAIEAMKSNRGVLEVKSSLVNENFLIEISDNGTGMDEETLNHIFEPFFSRKQKGNGLGLTNVQNIIHGHGGQIEVQSQPDKGSKFEILF